MNIESAKELLNKYKSLTLEQLEEKFDKLCECFYRSNIYGDDVMERITGFGSTQNCILCKGAKKLMSYPSEDYCDHCIYKLNPEKLYDVYCLGSTYDAITDAENAEDLYKAIQNRIKHLEKTIEIYEDRRLEK